MGTVPINFTPGQLRNAVGLGQETYRHWKKTIPPLRKGVGHSPCFTAGDLLATAIVRALVSDYGIRVSVLSELAVGVFEKCNSHSWPALERSQMVLDIAKDQVAIQSAGSGLVLDRPVMVVPLRILIKSLSRKLLDGYDDGKEMLRFQPIVQPANCLPRRAGKA